MKRSSARSRPSKRAVCIESLQATWDRRLAREGLGELAYSEDTEGRMRAPKTSRCTVQEVEQTFLYHRDFERTMKSIADCGNVRFTARKVKSIWDLHCQGKSLRVIAGLKNTSYPTVFRIIKRIREWISLLADDDGYELMGDNATVVLRAYNPETDSGMVYASWRNALWYDEGNKLLEAGRSADFFSDATKRIKAVVDNPKTVVKIATLSDDPDFIVGYTVMEATHLLWVYVKVDYRRKGIGRLLTKGFCSVELPLTRIGKAIFQDKGLCLKKLD